MSRTLIVNADDFGLSPRVNAGIIEAHEHGVVTSASVLVRWPAARAAADYGRARPQLSLGLHLDLGEWAYRDGAWLQRYEVVPAADAQAVAAEVQRQLDTFRRLVGRTPSHLDSHQHVHRTEPVKTVLMEVAGGLGVPLREVTPGIQYCGRFYGQTGTGAALPAHVSVEALLQLIDTLPEGVTELGCHPGLDVDLDSVYAAERLLEVKTLCAPSIRRALARRHIDLSPFPAALAQA